MDRILRFATTLMVAGSLIMASFSVGSGTAHATGPSYQGGNCPGGMTCTHWCPGDPTDTGKPSDQVGLEYLPRLVLDLGGCHRHRRQHHLSLARQSA